MIGGRNAPIVLNDLILIPVWATLLAVVARRLRPWPVDKVTTWTLAFIVVAVVSLVQAISMWELSAEGMVGPASFLARWILYAGWFWLVTVCFTAGEARSGVRLVERAIYAIAAFGILQSAFLPGFAQMVGAGGAEKTWDEQGRRLVSTMLDPNFAGILIVIALLLRLARERSDVRPPAASLERTSSLRLTAASLVLPLLGVALLLTLSRSAMLALAVGVVVLVWTRGINRRLAGIFLGGSLLLLPFITLLLRFAEGFNKLGLDASAAQRLVPWSRALIMLRDHPWLGVGFNAVEQAQLAYGWQQIGGADVSLDGGLLFVAAMTGVVGVAMYLALLGSALVICRRVYRKSTDEGERALASGAAAATVAVVVHSFFTNSLLLPFVMQVLWLLWGTVAVMARPLKVATRRGVGLATSTPAVVVAPLALVLLVAGCDPCAGVASCRTAPTIALTGQIVDGGTGRPVNGVTVSMSGAQAVSDNEGLWTLAREAVAGQATVDVTVQASGKPAYTVVALPVQPVTAKGDVQNVGRWIPAPYARYEATLVRGGQPLPGAAVSFAPTGGAPATAVVASSTSNGAGIFYLELAGSGALADVIGTLTVSHPSLPKVSRLEGFRVALGYRYELAGSRGNVTVGGQRTYGGEVIFRGTGAKAPNATVEFVRTGGVAMTPASASAQADERGFFVLAMDASADGEVIGDLTVRSGDGTKSSKYIGVKFATYDSTSYRSSGLWAFGERWAWAVELWTHAQLAPAPDVGVEFRRTGGIAITPDRIGGRTGSDGRFELKAAVNDAGEVIGELAVFPASGPPRIISNVRLRTFESGGLRFAGVFGFGPALRYVGEVLRNDGTPVVGAQVTWTQVSGIPASPTVLNMITDAGGRFPLTLIPSMDGEVVGTVRVRPPPPWAAAAEFTFTNLRLNSFETGDLRLAVTYRISPP